MSLAALLKPPVKNIKAVELTRLAKLIGISHAGKTKSAIAKSILDAAEGASRSHKRTTNPMKILSIDMGIQNLAYCRLERHSKTDLPAIKEWRRLSVLRNQDAITTSAVQDAFSTPELARTAVNLIDELIARKPQEERPDHILIERQRWRSMGGKSVLQWTIRVNTFEAMLWAVLQNHLARGTWEGQIHAVDPARVMAYWLENGSITGGRIGRKYTAVKQAKIDLVREWCSSGNHMTSDCKDSQAVFAAMRDRKTAARRKKVADETTPSGKLDDLADSLIQGITWLKWLENKELLAEKGETGLQGLLSG